MIDIVEGPHQQLLKMFQRSSLKEAGTHIIEIQASISNKTSRLMLRFNMTYRLSYASMVSMPSGILGWQLKH
jgi:hypothetical protein